VYVIGYNGFKTSPCIVSATKSRKVTNKSVGEIVTWTLERYRIKGIYKENKNKWVLIESLYVLRLILLMAFYSMEEGDLLTIRLHKKVKGSVKTK
jgi:hypothetical protein